MKLKADAVLFDKDGTLFDFGATWNVWTAKVIEDLSEGDVFKAQAMADAARYDLTEMVYLPDSPIIAGTNREAAECLSVALPDWSVDDLEVYLMKSSAQAPLVEAAPLVPLLARLSAMDLSLGVMTNDTEYGARSHLRFAGVEGMFDFIAGFDSGYGAKPSPAPLLAFAQGMGHPPERVVMVGDSTHDLEAGRAAGMLTVGVLTGPAGTEDLASLADVVLPDIGHLPEWLQA
ncbi:MAG: HAD family hydrolase [Pelagimonas sp.]